MMKRLFTGVFVVALVLALVLALAGCGGDEPAEDETTEATEEPMEEPTAEPTDDGGGEAAVLAISSSAFAEGDTIPSTYTCDGNDVSPPLNWDGAPSDAASMVLIADDPDAPGGTWVHWVAYNIPAATTELPEAASPDGLPAGAMEGLNDWGELGYGGPCPPEGSHRYFFRLYALDIELEGLQDPTRADVEAAMQDHIVAEAELMGTYERE